MVFPEYLQIFQDVGEYKIRVFFGNTKAPVAEKSMDAFMIEKLIDHDTGMFYEKMYFDDYLYDLYKYEIDPVNKIIKIRARKTNG